MLINITDEQRERASKFLTFTGDKEVDAQLIYQLEKARQFAVANKSNDVISMVHSQAYKYNCVVTMNAQAIQHLGLLRLTKSAHYDIRNMTEEIFLNIPKSHKYLFWDIVEQSGSEEFKEVFLESIKS